ncbi:MAG: class I SAM-dependent methyltransferase [Bacteroidetes bacterium]|nr:class I SAM-dependent methyltransferase [Bacteroidota bacterium]
MQKEWFENWFDSAYYHILYQNRSDVEASDFVHKCVQLLKPKPGDTLLDLACGKGRHSIAFSEFQLDVTGVDLSRESIAIAKKAEKDQLHFFVHDMQKVFRTNYYNYVCNLFTSFGYFKNEHENVLAARSIFQALKPGGVFIIDFVNRNHAIQNITSHQEETICRDHVSFFIKRSYTQKKFLKDIYIQDGEQAFHFQESVNSFTLAEMQHLFTSVGLTLQNSYGTYNLGAYDEQHSPRMILQFEKQV